jgi:hypothetical protein
LYLSSDKKIDGMQKNFKLLLEGFECILPKEATVPQEVKSDLGS